MPADMVASIKCKECGKATIYADLHPRELVIIHRGDFEQVCDLFQRRIGLNAIIEIRELMCIDCYFQQCNQLYLKKVPAWIAGFVLTVYGVKTHGILTLLCPLYLIIFGMK